MSVQEAVPTGTVIITCALTGGIHGKEANPNLPEQPDEIVEQGVKAWKAGAAILHVHARDKDGSNTMDSSIYGELHRRLTDETDAIIQLTTGGSPLLPVEERINTIALAPEMCSLNVGLLNFFIRGERVFFANHREDIEYCAREMHGRGVKPEFEVYSSAMLEEVAFILELDLFHPPYAINFVLHTPTQGGQRGTPQNLFDLMVRAHNLPVSYDSLRITVSSMGRTQLPMTTMGLAMGTNIRVGMEDNVMLRYGEPLFENAQLVERAVGIARLLDREPASPAQTRAMLGLLTRS